MSFRGKKMGAGGGAGGSNAPDTLFSEDRVEAVLGISEGPIQGLLDRDVRNFFVGDTPLKNVDGSKNFRKFKFNLYKGYSGGENIKLKLGGASSSVTVNTDLAYNLPVIRQGLTHNIDYLEIRMVIKRLYQETDEGLEPAELEWQVEHKAASAPDWTPSFIVYEQYDDQETDSAQEWAYENSWRTFWELDGRTVDVVVAPDTPSIPGEIANPSYEKMRHEYYSLSSSDEGIAQYQRWQQSWRFEKNDGPDRYVPRVEKIRNTFFWFDDNDSFRPYWLTYEGWDGTHNWRWEEIPNATHEALVMQDDEGEDVDVDKWQWETSNENWLYGTDREKVKTVWLNVPDAALDTLDPVKGDLVYNTQGKALAYNGSTWLEATTIADGVFYDGGTRSESDGIVKVNGKTTSPYVKEFRIEVPQIDEPYQIRITKLTDDSSDKLWADITWESFQEVTATNLSFPDLACVKIFGHATDQFNSIPDFWGVYQGRIVKVPSNYDPNTREYDGVWDGTWKLRYTNNPAYVVKDLVENDRYGLASVAPVTLNQWDVYEAGVWCDTPVSDGEGGTRPRFTFNMLIAEQQPSIEMINYVCGTFGARYFDDGNGFARIKIDDDRPAVSLFTRENVADGHFTFSATELTSRYNDINVTFTNPLLNWEEDRRRVYDQDNIDAVGRIPLDFIAVGCTNEPEAIARARYKLLTGLTETTMVTFRTNRHGLYLEPYDIILVADEQVEQGISGRMLEKLDARSFSVRDPVYLEDGFDYTLHIQDINAGQLVTKSYTVSAWNKGASRTEIRVTSDLPTGLPENAVWSIETVGTKHEPMPFRVLTIESLEDDPDNVTITAVQVNRNKWYEVDNGPTTSALPGSVRGSLQPITNPKVIPRRYRLGRQEKIALSVTWDKHPRKRVRKYSVWYQHQAGNWQDMGLVYQPQFELMDALTGTHVFRITAIHDDGRQSPPVFIEHIIGSTNGKLKPVKNLRLVDEPQADQNKFQSPSPRFKWGHPDEPFVTAYQVRILDTNGTQLRIEEDVVDTEYTYDFWDNTADGLGVPTRRFVIEVRAKDMTGKLSRKRTLEVNNPKPAAPDSFDAQLQGRMLIVNVPPIPLNDFRGVRIHASQTNGFTPDASNEIYKGPNTNLAYELPSTGTWYVTAAYYDVFDDENLNYAPQISLNANDLQAEDNDPPGDITTLTASGGPSIIVLRWTNPSDDDFNTVEIYRNTVNNLGTAEWIGGNAAESWVDNDIDMDTTYYYWVRAVDTSGNRGNMAGPVTAQPMVIPEDRFALGSINADKIRDATIEANKLIEGVITARELAANAVENTKIVDAAIDAAKLAADSIDDYHLKLASVTTDKLVDESVITSKIAQNAIDASKLAANSVLETHIQDLAVAGSKLQDAAVERQKLAAAAVGLQQLGKGAILADVGVYTFDGDGFARNLVNDGELTYDPDAYSGSYAGLVTSSNPTRGSAGATEGFSIEIPTFLAMRYAGKRIRVSGFAKQPATNAAAEFAVVFSTNADGNSGWQYFTPTTTWQKFSFTYDVPDMLTANPDYLGFWGDTSGSGLGTLFDQWQIEILTDQDEQDLVGEQHLADLAVSASKIANSAVAENHIQNLAVTRDKIFDAAINADKIEDSSIIGSKLAVDAVDETHIQNLAITANKLANAAVIRDKIVDDAIDASKLAASAVGTTHLQNLAVSADKIAANAVGTTHLQDLSVSADKIANVAITSEKIVDDAIDASKLAANAVGTTHIEDLSISAAKVANSAINSTHLASLAVTREKIVDDAIDASKLAANAVDTTHLQDLSVSADKIAANAVGTTHLQDLSVSADKVANAAITRDKIVDDAIDAAKLAANAVGTTHVQDLSISAAKVADAAIDAAKIAAGAVGEPAIAASAVTAGKIAAGAITTEKIDAGAITTQKIAAGAVTATEIAADAVTAAKIAAGAVQAGSIAAGAITTDKIAAGAITANEIDTDAVTTQKIAAGAITATEIASSAITTEKIDAGAITTQKIATGAVTATEIAADAVTTTKIAAEAVQAGNIAAGAVTTDKLDAGSITAEKLTIGGSGNMVHNSDFSLGHDYLWKRGWDNGGSWTVSLRTDDYAPTGHALQIKSNDPAGSGFATIVKPTKADGSDVTYPVVAGHRYQISAYVNSLRATAGIRFNFIDADGNSIVKPGVNSTFGVGRGSTLDQFERLVYFYTAPANATHASVILRHNGTDSGDDSYVWFMNVFFGEALPNQTEPSPWAPTGATTIGSGHIVTNAITTDKIDAGAITTQKIATGAITATEIAADSITSQKIAAGAVQAGSIAAGAITTDKIAAGAITANEIDANAITTQKIATGAITATEIASSAITTEKIDANAITTQKIAAGAITATELAADAVTASKIAAGAVQAGSIAAAAVTTDKIAAGAITADKIETNAVTASKIAAGTITASELATNSVTADKVAASAITGEKIAANSITADKIQAGSVDVRRLDADVFNSMMASGALVPRVVLTPNEQNHRWAAIENDTTILVNGSPVVENAQEGETGSISLDIGDIVTSTKPIGLNAIIGTKPVPLSWAGTKFVFNTTRSQPHSIYAHAVSDSATVTVTNRDTGSNDTITVAAGSTGTLTIPDNGMMEITSTAPVVAGKYSSGRDKIAVPPLSREVIGRIGGIIMATDGATNADFQTSGDLRYYYANTPFAVIAIADAAGSEAEMGAPIEALSDEYVIAHPLSGYRVGSIFPCEITVRYWDGSQWVVYETIDLTAASRTNFVDHATGDLKGSGTFIISDAPVRFSGSAPFFIRTNDGQTEYVPVGWRREHRNSYIQSAAMLDYWRASGSGSLDGGVILANSIISDSIAAGAITTDKLAAGAVTASEIASNAIVADKIDANAITSQKIAAGAVTATQIAGNTITGDKIVSGEIATTHLASGSVTADKVAANAITADKVNAGAITAEKLAVGFGGNFLSNSDFSAGLANWERIWLAGDTQGHSINDITVDLTAGNGSSAFGLAPHGSLRILQPHTSDGSVRVQQTLDGNNVRNFPVNGGGRIEVSVYTYARRCAAGFMIAFLDSDDVWVSSFIRTQDFDIAYGNPAHDLNNFVRVSDFFTVPASARQVWFGFYKGPTFPQYVDVQNTSDAWFVLPYIGFAKANQTEPSDWSPGGITLVEPGHIVTNAVTAEKIAANAITTDKLAANAITAAKIAGGTITGNEIAANAITASKIASGTITANEIGAGQINATHLAADAVTATSIAAGAVTGDKLASGVGKNYIENSDFVFGLEKWTGLTTSGGNWSLSMRYDKYAPPGGAVQIYTNTPGYYANIAPANSDGHTRLFSVEGGKYYEVSAYLFAHRCQGHIIMTWYDKAGGIIRHDSISSSLSGFGDPDWQLANYQRVGNIQQAPSNAVQVRLLFRHLGVEDGYPRDDAYLWMTRAYFGEAGPNQTELSPWSPGGITMISGGQITTNSINTNHLTAGAVNADKIAASAINATHIATDAVTTGAIATDAVTAGKIAADSITVDKLVVSEWSNLVPNGSLRSSDGWSLGNYVAWDDVTNAHMQRASHGFFFVNLDATSTPGGEWHWTARSKWFPVQAGKKYYCAFQAKLNSAGTAGVVGRLHFFDAGSVEVGATTFAQTDITNTNLGSGSWHEGIIEAPNDAHYAAFQLHTVRYSDPGPSVILAAPTVRRAASGELIVDGTIEARHVAANTITSNEIAANTITAGNIAAGAITSSEISSGAVTTTHMNANSINGDRIQAGTLHANKIQAGTIDTAELKADAITTDKINGLAVTTGKIGNNAVSIAAFYQDNTSRTLPLNTERNVVSGTIATEGGITLCWFQVRIQFYAFLSDDFQNDHLWFKARLKSDGSTRHNFGFSIQPSIRWLESGGDTEYFVDEWVTLCMRHNNPGTDGSKLYIASVECTWNPWSSLANPTVDMGLIQLLNVKK